MHADKLLNSENWTLN